MMAAILNLGLRGAANHSAESAFKGRSAKIAPRGTRFTSTSRQLVQLCLTNFLQQITCRIGFGTHGLMDVCRLPFRVSPCRQQANLRVAPRPETQAVEPALGLSVFLQPHKRHAFVSKAPRIDQPQGLRELRERSPQKKHAVRGRQISHRERAYLVNPHCGVMLLRRTLQALLRVAPGGIGIDHRILSDSYTPFSPASNAARARRMRSVAAA